MKANLPRGNPIESHCMGKRSFESWLQANSVARRKTRRNGASLHPYRCHSCGLWHLSGRGLGRKRHKESRTR